MNLNVLLTCIINLGSILNETFEFKSLYEFLIQF